VDALAQEARCLGVSLPALEEIGPEGHRALIEAGVRRWFAEVGAAKGMEYAEQFRYEKLGMLDKMLGTNYVEADF
jgi:hypothetical protein